MVNCLPRLMLKLSSLPWIAKASFKAATSNLLAVPIDNRYKVKDTATHWEVGDICTRDLAGATNHHIPQKVVQGLVLRVLLAGVGLLIDRLQPHKTINKPLIHLSRAQPASPSASE
jgi:hypothetical protein